LTYLIAMGVLAIILVVALIAAEGVVKLLAGVGVAIVAIIITLFSSVVIIPTGQFAVATWFGAIQPGYYAGGGGISLVNPLVSLTYISSQRTPFEVDAKLVSADQNPLAVSGQFPYAPNPAYTYLVLSKIGPNYQESLIQRSAQSAFRDGVSSFSWVDSVLQMNPNNKLGGRAAVEKAISNSWRSAVAQQLVTAGLTPTQAAQAFFYYDVQLNTADLDERVKASIANKVAAQQDNERQDVLTNTAEKVAAQRANEGTGYGRMLSAITQLKDQHIDAHGVADVIRAIAAYDAASGINRGIDNKLIGATTLIANPPGPVPTQDSK
jgi:regulator of protease activity HflC (stomatin/prohibitin superfamily)